SESSRFCTSLAPTIPRIQFRSAPAEKQLPLAASTTARTCGSASAASSAAVNAAIRPSSNALCTCGRLRVSHSAVPRRSARIESAMDGCSAKSIHDKRWRGRMPDGPSSLWGQRLDRRHEKAGSRRLSMLPGTVAGGSGQLADLCVETALVAGSLVLVDQAARGIAIHQRLGNGKGGDCRGLVLRLDGLDDLAQGAADHGTCADVAQAIALGLPHALLRGLDIGQGRTPECVVGPGKERNYEAQPAGASTSHHATRIQRDAARLAGWRRRWAPGRIRWHTTTPEARHRADQGQACGRGGAQAAACALAPPAPNAARSYTHA